MRLRNLQVVLWVAAVLAAGAFLALRLSSGGVQVDAGAAFVPSFALADGEGTLRTSEEFRGKFMLVFFGFTNCPDVCPTTLSEVAQVIEDLGTDASQVQPVFISIDPEQDRRLGLQAYTEAFHPAILGLAGTDTETQAAADSFKIYFAREAEPTVADGYSMSHSPGLFLIGPDGTWLRQFAYGTPATEILSDLKSRL
jgi:protein SCO1/2